jgi:site-specific DNA recombinase
MNSLFSQDESMSRKPNKPVVAPQPGWAVYLRTSSDEKQHPEMSRARQRFAIEKNVLERSDLPLFDEYVDVLTGKTPDRKAYQRLLADARAGKFSRVIVERADRFGRNDTEALRAIDELHEFGVSVRFANQPDLDPMDPDDRVVVALSFTLARRESHLLGLRVQGGLEVKRQSGGFCGVAPDGYRNVEEKVVGDAKKLYGRHDHRIELDPERAPIWRYAWNLLLEGKSTLEEICEKLHARGYTYRKGRPFVEITSTGQRRPSKNTLSKIFHNWTYAGWIISKSAKIPPKTVRGNWEPLVSTEEFEHGLAILEQRDQTRGRNRKYDYLLKGMVYHETSSGELIKLSCSTPNTSRPGGGTPYYCIQRSNKNFLCSAIDPQIAVELNRIQVAPDHIPLIQAAYTDDIAAKLGHLRPDEREQLLRALKAMDHEEARMVRLYAAGKISDAVWDSLWKEWQDRRALIRATLEGLQQQQETHIANLDMALKIIAQVGIVYNTLERSDQKELLRHMVERVIIDPMGKVKLDLHAPFAYLHDISECIRDRAKRLGGRNTKTGSEATGLSDGGRSVNVSLSRGGETRTPDQRIWRPLLYQLSYAPVYTRIDNVLAETVQEW